MNIKEKLNMMEIMPNKTRGKIDQPTLQRWKCKVMKYDWR